MPRGGSKCTRMLPGQLQQDLNFHGSSSCIDLLSWTNAIATTVIMDAFGDKKQYVGDNLQYIGDNLPTTQGILQSHDSSQKQCSTWVQVCVDEVVHQHHLRPSAPCSVQHGTFSMAQDCRSASSGIEAWHLL